METIKPKLPFGTIVAGLGGLVVMLLGAFLEGSPLMGFLNLPALLIIAGGTSGATMAAVGIERFLKIKTAFMTAQQAASPDWDATARRLVSAAEIARKNGVLKLQEEVSTTNDPFMAMAYQLLADGTEDSIMRETLWARIESENNELKEYSEIFEKMGGFAPTMGIIGTVMGLTHALQLLNEPTKLGPAIAGAFMATLYGVGSANLMWTPHADRLKALAKERKSYRGMIVAATMSIKRGDSPRQLAEKMAAMAPIALDPEELRGGRKGES
jgi:chemotaxis protein MotA